MISASPPLARLTVSSQPASVGLAFSYTPVQDLEMREMEVDGVLPCWPEHDAAHGKAMAAAAPRRSTSLRVNGMAVPPVLFLHRVGLPTTSGLRADGGRDRRPGTGSAGSGRRPATPT
jgi:hypothetical protein